VIVDELTPAAHAEWDAYVDAHPRGNLYHLRAWATTAARAYRLRTPFLVARARAGAPISGALPLFVIDNPARRYVTSGLFGAYGALLADSDEARAALLDAARAVTKRVRAYYLTLKAIDEPVCPPGFVERSMGVVATLSLEGGPDLIWKRFRDKIRNAIRKAQKSELELRVGPDELPRFYDVLAGNYHRKGTPVYGYAIMRELAAALGDRAEAVTLWKGDEAISGALVVYYKDTVYVPFCSSRAEHFKLNPNNLIYWEIMRRAAARGMKTLDFGRSPVESSSLAFKLGWGAITTPQPYFIHTARGNPPGLNTEDASVQRLIQFWQKLPRPVADALGPSIHRRFLV
jgi:FemAB-related protein (PEP-CTERM system-associated)